jgi:sterol desaturase/sphingolipid hydroxylase (fatty acid hydroxylase superfamily)
MNFPSLAAMTASYDWQLSLVTMVIIFLVTVLFEKASGFIPAVGRAQGENKRILKEKMEKPHYAANQAWNRKWSIVFLFAIFGVVLPFCLTVESQPWWRIPRDLFLILMAYDFVYYLTHRFVFHNGGWFDGPLLWMHAVHHRQLNPCRMDSSYIHPLEIAIGLGLYVATIFVLSRFLGSFHVVTVVLTWLAFSEINLHNHTRWDEGRFPFGYLNYASMLHHNHHARFTGGNFATISPLYDWMFGTLDHGNGYRAETKAHA